MVGGCCAGEEDELQGPMPGRENDICGRVPPAALAKPAPSRTSDL